MKIIKAFNRLPMLLKLVSALIFFAIVFAVGGRMVDSSLLTTGMTRESVEEIEEKTFYTVVPIIDLQSNGFMINITGEVESLNQAEIKSQVSSKVKNVYRFIGDEVNKGDLILEFQNDEIRAMLMQAEAGVISEENRLKEMLSGPRDEQLRIAELSYENAKSNLDNTKLKSEEDLRNTYTGALNSLRSSVLSSKEALLFITDIQYSYFRSYDEDSNRIANYKEEAIKGLYSVEDAGYWAKENINKLDSGLYGEILSLTFDDQLRIDELLTKERNVLYLIKNALDSIPLGNLNSGETTTLSIKKSEINGYISGISSTISGISVLKSLSRTLISNSEVSLQIAEQNLLLTKNSITDEQLEIQKARLQSSRASLLSATAQYNKTVVYAPISGKLSYMPWMIGDLVNPGELVVSIISSDGFRVKGFVNSDDIESINQGSMVYLDGKLVGEVLRISSGIDPYAKKSEVEIILTNNESVPGEFLTLGIKGEKEDSIIKLPLEFVKVTPQKAFVYLLEDGKVKIQDIILGDVVGEKVEILDGLDLSNNIIKSEEILNEGDKIDYEK